MYVGFSAHVLSAHSLTLLCTVQCDVLLRVFSPRFPSSSPRPSLLRDPGTPREGDFFVLPPVSPS